MNLQNAQVKHKKFGTGMVTKLGEDKLVILFDEQYGEKLFQFPDAFEKYLEIDDTEITDQLMNKIKFKKQLRQIELEEMFKPEEVPEKPKTRTRKSKTATETATATKAKEKEKVKA